MDAAGGDTLFVKLFGDGGEDVDQLGFCTLAKKVGHHEGLEAASDADLDGQPIQLHCLLVGVDVGADIELEIVILGEGALGEEGSRTVGDVLEGWDKGVGSQVLRFGWGSTKDVLVFGVLASLQFRGGCFEKVFTREVGS